VSFDVIRHLRFFSGRWAGIFHRKMAQTIGRKEVVDGVFVMEKGPSCVIITSHKEQQSLDPTRGDQSS
jgi:hypothetical protein